MHDLSDYEEYLEENSSGVGDRIKNGTPKKIYEELKEIDLNYFKCYKTHLFEEFRKDGDGDILHEIRMKAKEYGNDIEEQQ